VLSFAAGLIGEASAAYHLLRPQLQRAHQMRQTGIGQPMAIEIEFFLDQYGIAFKALKQLTDQRRQGFIPAGLFDLAGGFSGQDAPDGLARDLQNAADLADALAGLVHGDHGLSVG
jgi:hypothetical protein